MAEEICVTPTRCNENRSFSDTTPVRCPASTSSTWRKPCRAMSMAASKACAVDARVMGLAVITSRIGVVSGVPGRITKQEGRKIDISLDHIHVLDPLLQEIDELKRRIEKMEK